MDIDDVSVLAFLRKLPGLSDPAKVTTYQVACRARSGADYMAVVEVHDRGPGDPYRFTVVAFNKDDPSKVTSSNPFPDVETTLATTRYSELD